MYESKDFFAYSSQSNSSVMIPVINVYQFYSFANDIDDNSVGLLAPFIYQSSLFVSNQRKYEIFMFSVNDNYFLGIR